MTYKMLVERQHALIDVYNEEYVYDNKKYKGACFKITFTPWGVLEIPCQSYKIISRIDNEWKRE